MCLWRLAYPLDRMLPAAVFRSQPEPLWLNPALALAVLCTFRQELVVPSVVMFACSLVKASAQMDSLWSLHQTKSPN
jgi:hypothetical protein